MIFLDDIDSNEEDFEELNIVNIDEDGIGNAAC